MISLINVAKAFGANRVLRGVNLTIPAGSSMVVIGGSGTGKSVLLKCILGLVLPDSPLELFAKHVEMRAGGEIEQSEYA